MLGMGTVGGAAAGATATAGGGGASTASVASSSSTSHLEEAYRRLGQRLSAQAHGGVLPPPSYRPKVAQIGPLRSYHNQHHHQHHCGSGSSAFQEVTATPEKNNDTAATNITTATTITTVATSSATTTASLESPTPKVQKVHYADHGNHHPKNHHPGLLKSITVHAKERFQIWQLQHDQQQQQQQQLNKRDDDARRTCAAAESSRDCSNSTTRIKGSEELAPPGESSSAGIHNDESSPWRYLPQQQQQQQQDLTQQQQQQHSLMGPPLSTKTSHHNHPRSSKGLLAAVLEGHGENTSVTSSSPSLSSVGGGMSASLATGGGKGGPQNEKQKQRQECSAFHGHHHHLGEQPQSSHLSPSSSLLRGTRRRDENDPNALRVPQPPPTLSPSHRPQQQNLNPPQHHHHDLFPRGKCLTSPSEAVTNDGFDNIEGNLIVFENDRIVIPKQSVKTLREQQQQQQQSYNNDFNDDENDSYRIVSLLGQGTFAQVFQCLHLATGKLVAIKVVKNKAAYTRQAAIEVDIFRALQQEEKSATAGGGGGIAAGDGGEKETKDTNHSCYNTHRTFSSILESSPVAASQSAGEASSKDYMVNLECFFFYQSHLCLVFELLGLNLYEVLKRRQFRGLPLHMVQSIIYQALVGIKDLSSKSIVHCDLKPENVLLISEWDEHNAYVAGESRSNGGARSEAAGVLQNADTGAFQSDQGGYTHRKQSPKIKLIDFGSACFEGYTTHTYIQSRFYRSPEVLIGLPYDSAIDMWSLGCVAAELFLGLPILPGVHEHDQLGRITEMIGKIPDWMLDQGSKASKYYLKFLAPRRILSADPDAPLSPSPLERTPSPVVTSMSTSPAPPLPQWRLKTQHEYIESLTPSEIRKKGGLAKLEKQPGNRYFKCKRLEDILTLHARATAAEDRDLVPAFVHFLYGLLDPDPWRRLTALQALQHPFMTGDLSKFRKKTTEMKLNPKEENHANIELDYFWQCPWDPSVCRRKLLSVQKMREKQQCVRRNLSGRPQGTGGDFSFLHADNRRNRKVECPSSGSAMHATTPMDESSTPAMSITRRASSPPTFKVSCSLEKLDSTASSQPLLRKSISDSLGPSIGNQSSLSCGLPGIGARSPLQSGKDFVSGLASEYHFASSKAILPGESRRIPPNENEDLAYALALQRPGVIPGAGSIAGDASSFSSTNASVCSMVRSLGPTPAQSAGEAVANVADHFSAGIKFDPQNSIAASAFPFSHGSSFGSSNRRPGGVGATFPGQNYTPVSQTDKFSNQHGGDPTSSASTIATHESSRPNLMHPPQFSPHQQSMLLHQQPHMMMQPQQFGPPPPAHVQLPPGQMQTQFQSLQQPLYVASAPGGGYYYIATSAMGQPILLQPVAVLDQQSSLYGGNNMEYSIPHQGYNHHYPSMNLNLMHAAAMHVPIQSDGGAPMYAQPQHFGSPRYDFRQQHTTQFAPLPPT